MILRGAGEWDRQAARSFTIRPMISELIERAIHSNDVGYIDHIAPIGPIGGGEGRHPVLFARQATRSRSLILI